MEEHPHIQKVEDIAPGDHLCCIFSSEEEHRALLAPYLRHGLERNEKVLYITDAHTAGEVLAYLEGEGVDTRPYLESGQLAILTADDSYMKDGTFDPDGMIALLSRETELALSQGYAALRVTGEMTWALRELPGSERLMEYEAKLNRFFPGSACMAICQYDRRRFDPRLLLEVLSTHPVAVVGTEVYRNLYYVPPDEYLEGKQPASTLERWIANLAQRKAYEKAILESEERFRLFAEKAQDLIYRMRMKPERGFEYVSPSATVITGYTPEEHYADPDLGFKLVHPEDRHLLEKVATGELDPGQPLTLRWVRKDGSIIWTEQSNVYIHDEHGDLVAIEGIARDVTERKGMEEALRDSQQTMQIIFDSMPGLVFFKDRNNVILRANRTLCDALGMSAEEVEGKPLSEIFPEQAEDYWKDDLEVMESGAPKLGIQEPMQTPEGTRWLRTDKVPYRDADGEIVGVIGFSVDITELREAQRELEALNQELEAYAHAVSHDLRGPIAVIISAAGTLGELMKKCDDEKAAEQVGEVASIILRSSLSAVDLINGLLGLAKAGQSPRKVARVDVRESVERVLQEKAPRIEAKGARVVLDGDLGKVVADPLHIYQLFSNLIGNAIEHNDNPRPEIRVSGEHGGDGMHRYCVWDNGPGISPEEAEKIFQPLYSGKEGGTGIGLATVKKIVNVYGGEVKAYNLNGACIEFTLRDYEVEKPPS
jgi:PAS domain S-box-containing protein